MKDLTIVVPAYKCAPYLPATIHSALRFPDAPIIISENHGEDGTLEVARQLEAQYPDRIRVIARPENLGMTGNWQNTIEEAPTDLVLKLDGDDLVSANYIQHAVDHMLADPAIGISGGVSEHVDDTFGLNAPLPETPICPEDIQVFEGTAAGAFVLNWQPYPASASTIYRKSAWRQAKGFDASMQWCCDRDIWFRIGRHWKIAFCPKISVWYRVYPASWTGISRKSDRFCYELSAMYRHAADQWTEPELAPLFRRNFRTTSKAFIGSSLRAATSRRWLEIVPRIAHGLADLSKSI